MRGAGTRQSLAESGRQISMASCACGAPTIGRVEILRIAAHSWPKVGATRYAQEQKNLAVHACGGD
jgi:hypothetical protein